MKRGIGCRTSGWEISRLGQVKREVGKRKMCVKETEGYSERGKEKEKERRESWRGVRERGIKKNGFLDRVQVVTRRNKGD